MPELPEVETVKRIVAPQIIGSVIQKAKVLNGQIIAYPAAEQFADRLSGQRFSGLDRRGKFLIFQLETGDRLFLHLRMTGQLLVTPKEFPSEKHTHLVLHLDNGTQLRYIDVRRFGRFWYIGKEESESITGIDKLGLEPFDEQLTAEYLKSKLSRKKKPIKEMLHDQSVVAGIGNIYSDEILYLCGIYPETKCTDLTNADWEKLSRIIPQELSLAIKENEMSAEEYLAGKGKEYLNTPFLKSYGHEGMPCPICGSIFERITVGGRSSCYCPKCQKASH